MQGKETTMNTDTWDEEALGDGCGLICGPEDYSWSKGRREGAGNGWAKSRLAGTAGRQFPFKEKWLVMLAMSGAWEGRQTEARAKKVAKA